MKPSKNLLKITGLGYLVIFLTGFFSNFYVLENLVVMGNADVTTTNIIENEILFRWSIVSFFLMVISDLLLAWTLYLIFKRTNQTLSLLTAWLRIVNATVFSIALYNLISILHLVSNTEYYGMFESNLLQFQIMLNLGAFNYTWLVGLIFFGIHLLCLGWLIFKSSFIPKLIGALLLVAGIGYLVDSFANILLPNYSNYKEIFELIVILPGVLGEFSLTVWLIFRGFISKNNLSSNVPENV